MIRASLTLAALMALAGAQAVAGEILAPMLPAVVSAGAQAVAYPAPSADLPIAIVLAPRRPAELDRLLARLTDPRDALFRHWLSPAAFDARFAPPDADREAIGRLLTGASLVPDPAARGMVVDAHGRIADIERLLHVRFGFYRHPSESRLFLAPDREPTLTTDVAVAGIEGLTDVDRPRPRLVQAAEHGTPGGSGPHGQLTGQDARAAYYGHGMLTGAGQSVGVFELGAYDPADVAAYFDRVRVPLAVPVVPVSLNGLDVVCKHGCHDAEEALDLEEAISMAPGLTQVVYYGGKIPISILARMAADDRCAVLSVSWGWHPNSGLDEPVLKQMAAQGQSLLVATGDDGYHLAEGAVWPADDAWSIAVGGTDLATHGPGGPWRAETGWRYSGGGPSPDAIAIPAWQAPLVSTTDRASPSLRNVPDIAADADTDNFSCYNGHCNGGNGGTSYAAPIWAGFLALANEQAAREGRASVGFFTPALYAGFVAGAAAVPLHDQVAGFNGRYRAGPGFGPGDRPGVAVRRSDHPGAGPSRSIGIACGGRHGLTSCRNIGVLPRSGRLKSLYVTPITTNREP